MKIRGVRYKMDKLPSGIPTSAPDIRITDEAYVRACLPHRRQNSHKGTYGRCMLFCGSEQYPGAALLAAEAAFRVGCGMTYLVSTPAVREAVLARLPEVIFLPQESADAPADVTARLCGCGSGNTPATARSVQHFLTLPDVPLVLDADALNALSHTDEPVFRLAAAACPIVLTPHPAEFLRLFGGSMDELCARRAEAALAAAKQSGAVVLLKGHHTVIASPTGEVMCNPTGSSALAKAGSGDVLSGVIAGLLAQGMAPFSAAVVGAWLHGKAGDVLAASRSEYGVLPSELPLAVAGVLADLALPTEP